MAIVETILLYFFLFVSIYLEIFILTIYLGRRKDIEFESTLSPDSLSTFLSVTLVVPCFNEEKTVARTLDSLMLLDYPKDKLKIIVVDDGSTDNTWNVISEYKAKHPDFFEILHKENGGKYTALNYGIEHSTTDLIGCLDADSFVDPKTLKKIVRRFVDDPQAMAVTPAIRIFKPSTIVQMIQSAEYMFGILVKKIMSFLGAIHVTPGPFTIFRREVFQKIGLFRHAHNTEDMEIAFRMQANHLKIDNVHNAWIYTVGPNTVYKLYKQRLRWTHGFIENSKDYKFLYFNKKYGNLGLLTMPTAIILIAAVLSSVSFFIYHTARFIVNKFIEFKTIGVGYTEFQFSWFFISTKLNIILAVMLFVIMLTLMLASRRIVEGKRGISKEMVVFFLLYPFISPLWVLKSIYNAVLSKKTSWR
jgi:cellulose synthase/poly-beta-1,6-N-acetylglucosamine synthase-like glycosyltransferase